MKKISFEIVDLAVAQMYNSVDYSISDLDQIDAHCKKVESFLEACGWDENSYIDELINRGLKEFLTSPKDMSN
jgi:hypothetical protein